MKQRILSVALALCLCFSSQSMAYASQEEALPQEEMLTEEATSGPVAHDGEIDSTTLTPTGVYEAMIALKDDDRYKEGTAWTDYEPYSDPGYYWNGGLINGTRISAVGCVAFAFILSDAAFGSLPNRMYEEGGFSYEDIKVGDILRVNNATHTVIVLEVSEVGVVVAEGNYSGTVHWGRTISKTDVMNNTKYYITRYPQGYIIPTDPTANQIIESGTMDGGLTWELTKAGTLTISGSGAMPDFSVTLDGDGDQPWNDYKSQIRKVVIGDGVTSIGSFAFYKYDVLTANISSSVTEIGSSAFYGSSVIYVSIPSSVKTIGDSAFRTCPNLSSVTVSEGVETIEQNAFRSCTSLTSITLPASIGEVGAGAFYQCTALTNATFAPGSEQVKLGDNLFTGCYYLMFVTLPESIDCIGEGMFQNCHMLTGVIIPQGAESIGTWAFASSGVSVVVIPDSVTTIGTAAFSDCALTDIYFTGTEAQWNSISKPSAVISSTTAIHYDYVPDTGDNDDNDNNDNSGSGNNSGNNTGDNSGSNSGDNSGSNSGDNSGSNSGDNSGSNSGDNSGSNSGDNSGSNSGGNAGNGNNSETSDNSDNGNNPGSGGNSGNDDNSGDGGGQASDQAPFAKGKTFTVKKVTYKVTKEGEEVELTASKSTAAKVTINTVTGTDGVKYKVTSIGPKAMQNNKKLTNLTIGANVNTIGKSAFSGCKKLNKVTIKSKKLSSVGKQAFKGTKSSLKVKMPSKQLAKYKKLLKKAGLNVKQVTK